MIGQTRRQRYKIESKLGSGGFGDTYLAIDLDFPGQRKCVVKHLSPKQTDPEIIAIAKRLFESEAQSLSRLGESDRIPRLYAYFEEGEGHFFLVQEFIDGCELSEEILSGYKWQESNVVQLLQEILEILTIVHQENKIHRDINPKNIMRRNQDGKLMLIDFGAVKDVVNVNQQGRERTVAIGSQGYMPPEQAMGNPKQSSDVYAVGMIGIQALTGCHPHEFNANSLDLNQIFQDKQVQVSPETTAALDKMVCFKESERFQNAAAALKSIIPTEIEIPPAPPSATKPNKKAVLFILTSAIVLFGVGIGLKTFFNKPSYALLEKHLIAQDWQAADLETDKIILKVAGEKSALDADSISKFPCKSLHKIDELWTENSEGRFGFTPQEEAYLATGNKFDQYTQSTYEAFGDKVNWRTFGVWSLYGDLKFTKIATPGHLPSPGKVSSKRQDLRFKERGMLLSRFNDCR